MEGRGEIATWASGGGRLNLVDAGPIFAVDGMAKEFSDWGADVPGENKSSLFDDGVDESKACVEAASERASSLSSGLHASG